MNCAPEWADALVHHGGAIDLRRRADQNPCDFPHLKRWLETIKARPATVRAYAKAKEVNPSFGQPAIRTEEERKILFGQTAAVVR